MRFLIVSVALFLFWAAVWSIVWFRVFNVATNYENLSDSGSKFAIRAKREPELETRERTYLYPETCQEFSGRSNVDSNENNENEREKFSEM